MIRHQVLTIKLSLFILFVLFWNLVKVSEGQADARDGRSIACANKSESLNRSVAALAQAFSRDPNGLTDFIFIVDISGSIDDVDFQEMLDFIGYLIEFMSIRFELYIHPERSRVEMITFDDNAQFQIKNLTDRHVHACEFVDFLRTLQRHNKQGMTYIHEALDAAFSIFSKTVKNRVIIVLTDGEFNDKDSQVKFSSNRLKTIGATIFTVGLGYYFDEVAKAERLKMLASQDVHYACVEDWLTMLSDLGGGFDKDRVDLWAEVTEKQLEECSPECSGTGQTCGCNVAAIPPQYGCVCGPGFYKADNDKCIGCPPHTKKDKVGNDVGLCQPLTNVVSSGFSDGEIGGLIFGVILLILLLLFLLFIILCCLRKHERGSHRVNVCLDSVYERLRGSQRRDSPYDLPGNIRADDVNGIELPPELPKPRANPYIREPRHETEDEDGQDYVNISPNTDSLPKGSQPVHKGKASLFELLAIYDVEGETVQTHDQSRISRPEMTELLRVLRKGERSYQFVLQRKIYEVKNADANNFMQAEQINTGQTDVKTISKPLVMWSTNATDYVVIGVSNTDDSDKCKSAVFDMGVKLREAKRRA